MGSTGIKFFYDAEGRLTAKRINGTTTSQLLWSGSSLLAELNGAGDSVLTEYSYYGTDAPHAVIKQPVGKRLYARMDGLGNVLALTDTSGSIRTSYAYGDWGNLMTSSDAEGFGGRDRARWKGALWLGPQLDIYYMRNRWYEPQTGRFLSEDPGGLSGGINPVLFANNDPVNGADPSGFGDFCLYENWLYFWTPSGIPIGIVSIPVYCWSTSAGNKRFWGELMKEFSGASGTVAQRPQENPHTPKQSPQVRKCTGQARVLSTGGGTLNRQGGFPGTRVTAGSAAIIPDQFLMVQNSTRANKTALAPHIGQISATTAGGEVIFTSVSDVIGGRSPLRPLPVRHALQTLFPNMLIVERATGPDLGIVNIVLTIPNAVPCPTGTTAVP